GVVRAMDATCPRGAPSRRRAGPARSRLPAAAGAGPAPRGMSRALTRLPADPHAPFPPADRALSRPAGLLAFGGDLSPPRLLNAYRHGIFPWYSDGQPILWWSPDPRMVFHTGAVHLPGRFRRT